MALIDAVFCELQFGIKLLAESFDHHVENGEGKGFESPYDCFAFETNDLFSAHLRLVFHQLLPSLLKTFSRDSFNSKTTQTDIVMILFTTTSVFYAWPNNAPIVSASECVDPFLTWQRKCLMNESALLFVIPMNQKLIFAHFFSPSLPGPLFKSRAKILRLILQKEWQFLFILNIGWKGEAAAPEFASFFSPVHYVDGRKRSER